MAGIPTAAIPIQPIHPHPTHPTPNNARIRTSLGMARIFSVFLDLGLCRKANWFWCAGPRVRRWLLLMAVRMVRWRFFRMGWGRNGVGVLAAAGKSIGYACSAERESVMVCVVCGV